MDTKRARVAASVPASATSQLSVGRPRYRPETGEYITAGGVKVSRGVEKLNSLEVDEQIRQLTVDLDTTRGGVFQSAYEFPGRYSRWSLGFKNPPLVIESRGRAFWVTALNERGAVMLPWIM